MNNEIKVRCHTNLDLKFHPTFPDVFSCRPMIGDMVQLSDGTYLKICMITHCVDKRGQYPYLDIE